nr:zinc finger protein 2 homolog isoform X2 [Procambarus clarkii]
MVEVPWIYIEDVSLSSGLLSVEEMQMAMKVDGEGGGADNPPSSTDPQQMSTTTDIPDLHKLHLELRLEDLTCACGVKSNSKVAHVEHVLTHVTGAFRCPQCQCSYTCSSRLACHQRLVHSTDAPKERVPETVKSASTSSAGGDIICSRCDETVVGDILEHIKIHLDGDNECPVCAVRLKTSYAMEIHVERKHPHLLQAFLKSEDSLKEIPEGEENSSQPVRCDVCSKVVATASKLARHRYLQHPEHYPWACPDCNLTFPSHHTRENHTCPYRRKGGAVLAVGGQKNECCMCRIVCKSKLSLERHMRRAHPTEGTGPHTCPVCARILVSRKALTDHLRCHRRQQGFSCEFCNAQLKTMDSLNVHVNEIHTHVVRLQCKHCPQVFFSSGRLSYHIKRHHTDRRSYTNLCHLCGKAYPYPSELKLHLRSHRNERPYKCNQCQKTFLKQGDLTYHKRSHTGERPHKCPHCDARFPRPNTLMSHIRQQHRERTDADTSEILNAPRTITSETPVATSPVHSYVTSAPATVVTASPAPYLATVNPSATMQPPPPTVTVMSVAGAVPRAPGEATLVPMVDGQLVDAVVDGQVTEMQPVQYVQVDSLSGSQTVQAVPHTVEGIEYDEAATVPYQIVHLQILQ